MADLDPALPLITPADPADPVDPAHAVDPAHPVDPTDPAPAPAPAGPAVPVTPAQPNAAAPPGPNDSRRLSVGRDLLGLSLLAVISSLVLAIAFYRNASDVATVVAPITTLVGTLIGAMFGVQAASQNNADQAAQQQKSANLAVAAAFTDPNSEEAKQLVRHLLGNSTLAGNPGAPGSGATP